MTEKLNYIDSYTLVRYFESVREYEAYEKEIFRYVLKKSMREVGDLENFVVRHRVKSFSMPFSEIEYYMRNVYYPKNPSIYLFTKRIAYTDSISGIFLDKNVYYYV